MKLFHAVSLALGAALLILLTWNVGVDAVLREFAVLGWGLAAFILIEGLVSVLHTLAWRYCLSPSLRELSFLRLFGIHLAGYSFNLVTPTADIGGEVIKGTLLALNGRGSEAATGVIIGKLAHALALLAIIVAGSFIIAGDLRIPAAASGAMLAASVLVGSGIVALLVIQIRGKLGSLVRWFAERRVGGPLLAKSVPHVNEIDSALERFYRERPLDLPIAMIWHTAANALSIVNTWLVLVLLAGGSFFSAAGIWLIGNWLDLITFAVPMGLGVLEGSRVLAFSALGFSLSLGLTYGFVLRLAQLFWSCVGLFAYAILLAEKRLSSACRPRR